jgi:hypothetical protein
MLRAVQLHCAEIATAAADEDAFSSDDEASATPVSSTAALTALSGAISEADLGRVAGADAKVSQRAASVGAGQAGSVSAAEDEAASASEAAASRIAADWQEGADGGAAKKKRNRKQRYKDNLVSLFLGFCCVSCFSVAARTGLAPCPGIQVLGTGYWAVYKVAMYWTVIRILCLVAGEKQGFTGAQAAHCRVQRRLEL